MSKHTARIGSERAAAVYRALRHAIIEQALEPGAKLPEDTIGERFGVSRTLARHALVQLAAEGLVELRRNRGAAVARPSWDEARDIFDVRCGLERLVVQRLVGQLTPEQSARLAQHVADEEAARGSNEPLSIRLAGEFHILLAEMTGNQLLARYVGEVTSRSGLILSIYGRPHSSECAVSEHRAIIAALAGNDAEPAAATMPHVDRRLVEIARALATRPKVLLLDKPAAGLMRADKAALGAVLRRLVGAGLAVVLVEHDMTLVMGVSDHVVVPTCWSRAVSCVPRAPPPCARTLRWRPPTWGARRLRSSRVGSSPSEKPGRRPNTSEGLRLEGVGSAAGFRRR